MSGLTDGRQTGASAISTGIEPGSEREPRTVGQRALPGRSVGRSVAPDSAHRSVGGKEKEVAETGTLALSGVSVVVTWAG